MGEVELDGIDGLDKVDGLDRIEGMDRKNIRQIIIFERAVGRRWVLPVLRVY